MQVQRNKSGGIQNGGIQLNNNTDVCKIFKWNEDSINVLPFCASKTLKLVVVLRYTNFG